MYYIIDLLVTSMVSRLGNRPISKKLIIFEYLCALIEWIKTNKMSSYNYNRIAEKLANEYKITRKEKEIIIDLLDSYYPIPKADIGDLGEKNRKNKR